MVRSAVDDLERTLWVACSPSSDSLNSAQTV